MIRRFTFARFVPADAGAKDKNPMGSMLFSAPIIALSVPDCHQILGKSCQGSVRKRLNNPTDPPHIVIASVQCH